MPKTMKLHTDYVTILILIDGFLQYVPLIGTEVIDDKSQSLF